VALLTENLEGLGSLDDEISYLAVKGTVSASTQNQAFTALLFLFRQVLKGEEGPDRAPPAVDSAELAGAA
jgi:Phage integrase, N-terminal SAM-like domain